VSEEQADDMFEYTYQWLTKAIANRPSQLAEIQSVLAEVNLTISEAGNKPPQGHGVQWWQPFFSSLSSSTSACLWPGAGVGGHMARVG